MHFKEKTNILTNKFKIFNNYNDLLFKNTLNFFNPENCLIIFTSNKFKYNK